MQPVQSYKPASDVNMTLGDLSNALALNQEAVGPLNALYYQLELAQQGVGTLNPAAFNQVAAYYTNLSQSPDYPSMVQEFPQLPTFVAQVNQSLIQTGQLQAIASQFTVTGVPQPTDANGQPISMGGASAPTINGQPVTNLGQLANGQSFQFNVLIVPGVYAQAPYLGESGNTNDPGLSLAMTMAQENPGVSVNVPMPDGSTATIVYNAPYGGLPSYGMTVTTNSMPVEITNAHAGATPAAPIGAILSSL
jgi:hypothetical protein